MGRYQDGYAVGCDSVFHYQWRIDGVDLGGGEGQGFRRREGTESGMPEWWEGLDGVVDLMTQISIASHTQKYDPTYRLTVNVSSSRTATPRTLEISSPFTRWFDTDGYFVAKPFQQWLASEIEIVGEADPKNAEAAKKVREGYVELTDGDVRVADTRLIAEGDATGKETPGKKARERSKKSKQ